MYSEQYGLKGIDLAQLIHVSNWGNRCKNATYMYSLYGLGSACVHGACMCVV